MYRDELVSTSQAADLLNISTSRVNLLCRQGRFHKAEKIGGIWIIPRQSVVNFSRLKRGPKPQGDYLREFFLITDYFASRKRNSGEHS